MMELIVSDFMTRTCVVYPQPNINRFNALNYLIVSNHKTAYDDDYSWIATSSGSTSEFYIDPVLPCVNDVDVMMHSNAHLAVPARYPVPRCLPPEFHNRKVTVYELERTQYPCFVLARIAYKLTKQANSGIYKLESTKAARYAGSSHGMSNNAHGPATVFENVLGLHRQFRVSNHQHMRCSVDSVQCIRCLVWPPQAAEWLARRREHGWPDSATIDYVVTNGCDVVPVAHPNCNHDDSMHAHQWRLSFSRAETVLLNSWSPKQQLVYHVLRVVITIIQSNYQDTIIRRYYLKTLMLWACERHSENWWNARCIVSICTQLLHELADGLRLGKLPMYFVTECNLFDSMRGISSELLELFVCDLYGLNNEQLSLIIVYNYVSQCTQLYSPDMVRLFNEMNTCSDLQYVLSHIINRTQGHFDENCYIDFSQVTYGLQKLVFTFSLKARSCHLVVEHLQVIDSRLTEFFFSLMFLNTLSKLEHGYSASHVAETIITVLKLRDNTRSSSTNWLPVNDYLNVTDCLVESVVTNHRTLFDCKYSRKAFSLMRLARNLHADSSIALLIESSKVYLHSSVECACNRDNEQKKFWVSVHLSSLYCSTGQYHTAAIYCRLATTPMNYVNYRIERELLPQFDDRVDNVLGIVLLYQYSLKQTLRAQQRTHSVDSFSTQVFARHLTILCNGRKCKLTACEDVMIADILLLYFDNIDNEKTGKVQLYFTLNAEKTARSKSLSFDSSRMRQSLLHSAVECLNVYRHFVSRDFSSVRTIVTSDYEAMYAYKCGLYEQCFRLSYNNVKTLMHALGPRTDMLDLQGSDLFQLLDNEFLSLISLARLCGFFDTLTYEIEPLTQLTVSCFLVLQSKLRLKHSLWTYIDVLRDVKHVFMRTPDHVTINSTVLLFIYRKAILRVKRRYRSENVCSTIVRR